MHDFLGGSFSNIQNERGEGKKTLIFFFQFFFVTTDGWMDGWVDGLVTNAKKFGNPHAHMFPIKKCERERKSVTESGAIMETDAAIFYIVLRAHTF